MEGVHDRIGGRRVRGQVDPPGGGRAGGPRKYPPVGREGIGTSTVVRGKCKGEGGQKARARGAGEERSTRSLLYAWLGLGTQVPRA